MHLRPENVLFIDDDPRNLEEAGYCNPVPFIVEGDFQTSIFSREYHVICYSLLPDCHADLYRNEKTGGHISFGSRNFDLTAPENTQGYVEGSIVNYAFPFTGESRPLGFFIDDLDNYALEHVFQPGIVPFPFIEEVSNGSAVAGAVLFEINGFPVISKRKDRYQYCHDMLHGCLGKNQT